MRASATLSKGRIVPDDPIAWAVALADVAKDGERVVVTVEKLRARRTDRQLRYYWKFIIVEGFQAIWSKARTSVGLPGYTKDETHSVLVQILLGTEPGPLPGTWVPVRTRDLTTKEYAELTDKARALAWDEYQTRIPEPNEVSL